jgi:hypothetical protein
VLEALRGVKAGEDCKKDKEIVDREELLQQIRRHPHHRRPASKMPVHAPGKAQRHHHPHSSPAERGAQLDRARAAQQEEIDHQHRHNERIERQPEVALLVRVDAVQQMRGCVPG